MEVRLYQANLANIRIADTRSVYAFVYLRIHTFTYVVKKIGICGSDKQYILPANLKETPWHGAFHDSRDYGTIWLVHKGEC